jgi:uridine kinase
MSTTPPKKLTPMLYSPKYSSSLRKSKALERLVDVFLEENFDKSNYISLDMADSNDSLGMERKFMESETRIL